MVLISVAVVAAAFVQGTVGVGFALIAGAPITGPIATILFGMLMLKRIAIEERALGLSKSNP